MNEPIKSGDSAVIVMGALGEKSPNIGKAVTVGQVRGDHSVHGRIWRVHGEGLASELGGFGTQVDCPAIWLKKIDPDQKTNETNTKTEVTA